MECRVQVFRSKRSGLGTLRSMKSPCLASPDPPRKRAAQSPVDVARPGVNSFDRVFWGKNASFGLPCGCPGWTPLPHRGQVRSSGGRFAIGSNQNHNFPPICRDIRNTRAYYGAVVTVHRSNPSPAFSLFLSLT
ncbi:hypothetical protein VTK26DRAFT_9414 [Humicola hyalothermophila]